MGQQLPARIGKYELEECLGGGMSEVYRARDTVIGRTVVIKILTEEGSCDPDVLARFLQEARLAGSIDHDNVISIYDFAEDARHRPYIVMEFLQGENLRHAIRDGHLGDLQAKMRIALQVARALEHIHSLAIVHRDIKPENIQLTPTGVVKLMDFGIAKTQGLLMTRTGYLMGTPHYMAPEQVLGKNIGPAVDIYAFGALFFELLTGVRPVTGDTVERIFHAILDEPLDLEPLKQSGTPQPICGLVARCMAKNTSERFPGFGPICEQLDGFLTKLGSETRLVVTKKQRPIAFPAPVAVCPARAGATSADMRRPSAVRLKWAACIALALIISLAAVERCRQRRVVGISGTNTMRSLRERDAAVATPLSVGNNFGAGDMYRRAGGIKRSHRARIPGIRSVLPDKTASVLHRPRLPQRGRLTTTRVRRRAGSTRRIKRSVATTPYTPKCRAELSVSLVRR